jgi:hypothetical protein
VLRDAEQRPARKENRHEGGGRDERHKKTEQPSQDCIHPIPPSPTRRGMEPPRGVVNFNPGSWLKSKPSFMAGLRFFFTPR